MVYNTERPHDALALAVPITRYRPSWRRFPETLEPFDYGPGTILRRVDADGWLSFRNRPFSSAAPSSAARSGCARRPRTAASTYSSAATRSPSSISAKATAAEPPHHHARPGGSTGTSRASLRRICGDRCAMRGSLLWTTGTRATRSPCPRTPVHHVSGLYTQWGGEGPFAEMCGVLPGDNKGGRFVFAVSGEDERRIPSPPSRPTPRSRSPPSSRGTPPCRTRHIRGRCRSACSRRTGRWCPRRDS